MSLQGSGLKLTKQKLRFPTTTRFFVSFDYLTIEHVDFDGVRIIWLPKSVKILFGKPWFSRLCSFRCLPYARRLWISMNQQNNSKQHLFLQGIIGYLRVVDEFFFFWHPFFFMARPAVVRFPTARLALFGLLCQIIARA